MMRFLLLMCMIFLIQSVTWATNFTFQGNNYATYEMKGVTINAGESVTLNFGNIAGYEAIDFDLTTASGTIPTMAAEWALQNGTVIKTGVIRSGIGLKKFYTGNVKLYVKNLSASQVKVTGNIIFLGSDNKKSEATQATQSIAVTPTTLNIAEDGDVVVIPTNGNIRIDVVGGTPDANSPLVEQNEILKLGWKKTTSVIKAYSTGAGAATITIITEK